MTTEVIAAVLRGDRIDVQAVGGDALLAAAAEHDVVALVAERIRTMPGVAPDVRARFDAETHAAAAMDLAAEKELLRLLRTFDEQHVDALLLKGSHLAYTHYPRPDLRARIDTDLLVDRSDRDRAHDLLLRLGYVPDAKPAGELTATQKLYVLARDGVDVHLVDLHWRLTSAQAFAHVLTFDELRERAVSVPALGAAARGPSNVHALLVACTHRIAHHHDQAEQLKWIYDIHLIASSLSTREWDAFVTLMLDRGVAAVCRDGLERSAALFHTSIPDRVRFDRRLVAAAGTERTAAFLRVRPKAREVLDDLRALPSWSDRIRLTREHLFPDAAYMRAVYAPSSGLPLLVLYAQRIARGAAAWLKPR